MTGSPCVLQTKKDNAPAKSITQREFCDRALDIKDNAHAAVSTNLSPKQAELILQNMSYSFDNAAFHSCADLLESKAGISPAQRAPLPPWGPDFNQPVEHAHGRFKMRVRELVNGGWWPATMEEFWEVCQQVWEEVNGGSVVSADVERLPALYQHVANVSMGDWAPPHLS